MDGKRGSPLFMYRHLIGGRFLISPCRLDVMTPGDMDEALKLHDRVTHGLSPEIFVPTGPDDLERLVGGEGISVGVWSGGKLICMRAVMTDARWVNETLEKMGVPAGEAGRAVYTDHCIVDKEFRGNNVQFLTHYAIEHRVGGRCGAFFTTVSPKNAFSLSNVLGCGFAVIGMKELYGGYMRYIMRKQLDRVMPIWTHGHLVIPVSDVKRQKEAIAEGMAGYKMIRKNRGHMMLYAPMAEHPPRGYWKNMADGK
ncbi:MAG: hypothetical protein LBE65_06385 [Synergistaceae bacterium]|jgi:hypothetical protein|nr:hypothetical protein [Synergistaceae bacterium]